MGPSSSIVDFISFDPRPLILWLFVLAFIGGIALLLSRWSQRHWRPSAGDYILFLAAVAFIADALTHYVLGRLGITAAYVGGPLFSFGPYLENGRLIGVFLSVGSWHLAPAAIYAALYVLMRWNARKDPETAEAMAALQPIKRQPWTQRLAGFLSSLVLVYVILAIFSIALQNRASGLGA